MGGNPPSRPVHGRATLLALHEGHGIGYELDGVTYGVVWPGTGGPGEPEAARVALLHAAALDLLEIEVQWPMAVPPVIHGGVRLIPGTVAGDPTPALQAARLALVLARLAGALDGRARGAAAGTPSPRHA
ncbi:hypothetical protein [Deinococcus apachensis]|uniref:hypothetical protein n=1 Tax=Deinococcus apachensis TaxID=309886 RepID=UPI0012F78BD3|nr:hypothetical protein [Deinococcus apachensis]